MVSSSRSYSRIRCVSEPIVCKMGPKGRHERLRYVLGGSLVEASSQALGQASSEGLDRSSNVVYELRAGAHQRLTRADDGHMGLGVFAPMFEWVQELRVHSCQASQVLGVYLI